MRVSEVADSIDLTIPISPFEVLNNWSPTESSVTNEVPVPVMV